MLQILIWAVCILIIGVGYCGMELEKLAARDKVKRTTGQAFLFLMFLLALGIFALSWLQGKELLDIVK